MKLEQREKIDKSYDTSFKIIHSGEGQAVRRQRRRRLSVEGGRGEGEREKKHFWYESWHLYYLHCSHFSPQEQKQIREGSNNGEGEHGRAATGEMKYFTLSPGFPPSSQVFCSSPCSLGLAPLQRALPPRERTPRTHGKGVRQKEKKKKAERRGEETRLGMSLSVLCPDIIPPLPPRWQEAGGHWSRVWCDTLPRPFILHHSR